jgi:hypothetical protein
MIDPATLAQMNGEYAMPSDAGPAWRAAHEAGHDMSVIESSLELTSWQRMQQHDAALAFHNELRAAAADRDA